jgi:exonuclease III
MANFQNLSLCTYNCRSVKNSFADVRQLCDTHDIVLLQEHWLLPFELNILSDIHSDFLVTARSAVNIANDLLKGRPYGGTGILYRRKLAKSINVIDTNEPRLTAITIDTKLGPTLLVNVYMPTDYGDAESFEEFTDMCAKITALFHDNDVAYLCVIGDFNCGPSTRFYKVLHQFVIDNSLACSDINRLHDVFTYCRDDGSVSSWIDHVLCSKPVDDTIRELCVLLDYQCSDHKPLTVCFSGLDLGICASGIGHHESTTKSRDWSEVNRHTYLNSLTIALSTIDIPLCLITCCSELNCTDISHRIVIDQYYSNIISVVQKTTEDCVPAHNVACIEHNVPGWSDYVKENHADARSAFLEWISDGKPRYGASHTRMCTSRAKLKLTLRYCRHHVD